MNTLAVPCERTSDERSSLEGRELSARWWAPTFAKKVEPSDINPFDRVLAACARTPDEVVMTAAIGGAAEAGDAFRLAHDIDLVTDQLCAVAEASELRLLGDEALLTASAAIERLGRRLDALRVVSAGEIGERSRKQLAHEGLAARKGCRSANELMQRVTRISGAAAQHRLKLGAETRPNLTVAGFSLPARYSLVGASLESGELGVDAATAIVRGLDPVIGVGPDEHRLAAERELVAAATGCYPERPDPTDDAPVDPEVGWCAIPPVPCVADEIRMQALVWRAVLDPDGSEPAEDRLMAKRSVRIGAQRDGLVPLSGQLMPEVAARLAKLFDAYLSPTTGPAFPATALSDAPDTDSPNADAPPVGSQDSRSTDSNSPDSTSPDSTSLDSRSLDQRRHDILVGIIDQAIGNAHTPTIGGAAATVLVTVRERDLTSGRGAGFIDGAEMPVSIRAAHQMMCSGGQQNVTVAESGRVLSLGSVQRCFTPSQRRAIAVRDGGCGIPGCRVPASWCEIHHVVPAAVGGPTHTDNGVAVCWFHHRSLDVSGWQIRMKAAVPEVKAPPWIDPRQLWRPAAQARVRLLDKYQRLRT